MMTENHGPEVANSESGNNEPEKGRGLDSGIENAGSEPKPATGRPEDWSPPPGNPGSDQDAQTGRENGGAKPNRLVDSE
jgi:hypothetical protein